MYIKLNSWTCVNNQLYLEATFHIGPISHICRCLNYNCTLPWTFLQAAIIEPCFNFLNILSVTDASVCGNRKYLQWKQLFMSLGEYEPPPHPYLKLDYHNLSRYLCSETDHVIVSSQWYAHILFGSHPFFRPALILQSSVMLWEFTSSY